MSTNAPKLTIEDILPSLILLNILDIITLVNTILDAENQYNICNDLNNDDIVNILDIIYLIQIIL